MEEEIVSRLAYRHYNIICWLISLMSPNHMRRALGERWFGEVIHGSLGFYNILKLPPEVIERDIIFRFLLNL